MSVKENTIWEVTLTPNNKQGKVVRFTEKPTAHALRVALKYRQEVAMNMGLVWEAEAALLLEIAQYMPQDFVAESSAHTISGDAILLTLEVADVAIATIETREQKTYTIGSR